MRRLLLKLWREEAGVAQYVALAIALPILLMAAVAGTALIETVSAQSVLHNTAEIVDRSLVADGCLTQNALTAAQQTLQANNMNPNQVYLDTTGGSGAQQLYGQRGLSVNMGYDLNLNVPGTNWSVAKDYVRAQVASDQSQYVPNVVNNSSCISTTAMQTAFQGTRGQNGVQLAGGSSSGVTPPATMPTAITEAATPTTATVGETVTVSGQVLESGSPAPAGVAVAISSSQANATAQTNAQGGYTATLTFSQPGTVQIGVMAGLVTQTATVDVIPAQPATIQISAPSAIVVGQPFTISGTVLDAAGQAVADGTQVSITSNDAADVSNQTTTTTAGQFIFDVSSGITSLATNPVTVSVSASPASQSASIQVQPGAPQSVSFSATPSSETAGSQVSVSGQVLGPDGTAVAAGTQVTIQSPNDTADTFPVLTTDAQGNFSGTVTLDEAGQIDMYASAGKVQSAQQTVQVSAGVPNQVAGLSADPSPVNMGANDIVSGTVFDQYGNPVATGTQVTLTSTGFASPVSATTGAGGEFATTAVFQSSGMQVVSVQYQGATLLNGTATVSVNMQGAYSLVATQSATTIVAGQTQAVTFTLEDSNGNPVAGDTIDFTETPEGTSSLSATSATTNSAGQVTINFSPTEAGNAVLTASLAADNGTTTGTAAWIVSAASESTIDPPAITPSVVQSISYGGTVDPQISGIALDQYGNPIAGATVTITGGWDPGVNFTGTTDSTGTFNISLTPVDLGGPFYPTITVQSSQGTTTQTYTDTSLSVVKQLYYLTVTSLSGANVPAGTPEGFVATLSEYGGNSNVPVAGASITLDVSSSDSASSSWSTATPTLAGPTSVTVTTNSQGQATANVAFENNLGSQTVEVSYPYDSTQGSTTVNVTANTATAAYWGSSSPNPVVAGQPFKSSVQLVDSYGFPVAAGEAVGLAFPGSTGATWTTAAGGQASGSVTSTLAGSGSVTVTSIAGQSVSGLQASSLETVVPAPMAYFYPKLGPANNTGGTMLSGNSWTAPSSPAQGPTNAFGTLSDPPTGGSTYSVAGVGFDQYGNQETSASATLSCAAASGGACPSLPASASAGWQNVGAFVSGAYTLTLTPSSSSGGIASAPTTTHLTFTVPGLVGWNVQVTGSASAEGNYGSTINLGTFSASSISLQFSVEGIDENGNPFVGYTNNGTGQLAISGAATVPLGSAGTPNGWTAWSGSATFGPGTYTLTIPAGNYGAAGGQNWTPSDNTSITFTVASSPYPIVSSVTVQTCTSGGNTYGSAVYIYGSGFGTGGTMTQSHTGYDPGPNGGEIWLYNAVFSYNVGNSGSYHWYSVSWSPTFIEVDYPFACNAYGYGFQMGYNNILIYNPQTMYQTTYSWDW